MRRSISVLWAAAVGAAVVASLLWYTWSERRFPHFEGRSVRSWFQQLARSEAVGGELVAPVEARRALVALGTNALPFLLEQAMTFRRDTSLRTNLFELLARLPPGLGRGSFVPYPRQQQTAARALRSIRPPARWLLDQLRPHLDGPDPQAVDEALFLLGGTRETDPEQCAILSRALAGTNQTNSGRRAIVAESLSRLGPGASNALPAVVEFLSGDPDHLSLLAWIGRLGPAAVSTVPLLESALGRTNAAVRLHAAVALEWVQPGHREARRLIEDFLSSPTNPRRDAGPGHPLRPEVFEALHSMARPTSPYLTGLVAPLAEAEIAAMGSTVDISLACAVLEKLDPERAVMLYRARLAGPDDALEAANSLLRLQRTDAEAAAVLMAVARQAGDDRARGLYLLRAGSSSLPGLTNLLASAARDSGERLDRTLARASLAWIRYRETRVARGLPEGE